MFKVIGYQIPPNAVNSPDRKQIACSKLNIASPPFVLAFNPINYTSFAGTSNKKEASYSRQDFDRNSYLGNILDSLSGADIRVLVKYLEERSQMVGLQYNSRINILTLFKHYQVKFSKAFPSPKTHSYFMFMDSLSYHDKLLDAFETRYIPSCIHDNQQTINMIVLGLGTRFRKELIM